MGLTVRLRGLPPAANDFDICSFFCGMKIAQYGVDLVGGARGEAFVTFEHRHNTLMALTKSGERLMGSPIHISAVKGSPNIPGYVRISFRPLNVTESHVKSYFKEFFVESVIFLKRKKVNSGVALIKFRKMVHALRVLSMFPVTDVKTFGKLYKNHKTFTVLTARKSQEWEWVSCRDEMSPCSKKVESCPKNRAIKRAKVRTNQDVFREFYAHLMNVSVRAEKSHVRKFFHNLVDDSRITFLYNKDGNRQQECFVRFLSEDDYIQALKLDKGVFKGRCVRVLPVSKEGIRSIQSKGEVVFGNPILLPELDVAYLYLRNFAAWVNKRDVLDFFEGFSLTERDVCLLYDDRGDSLGEALVKFSTKEEASMAEKLNHKRFQDTEILVRCISKKQLKVFGVDWSLDYPAAERGVSTNME
ncbi:RNA-binding protein 12B-like [Engystomops pustulosus]|uniref:RNA-binding protein 12B-like n=1 Tax=Engystomops pustulosus TaxID=76066 RepID=UPI003AFA94B1